MSKKYGEIPTSEWDRRAYAALHAGVKIIGASLFGFRTEGAENIPDSGRCIIASTHLHASDVFFVPAAVPNRHVTVIGRRGQMQGLQGKFFERFGAITIDRPEDNEGKPMFSRDQLLESEAKLEEDRLLLAFSGGTRTPNEPPKEVRRGVVLFARHTESIIIPTVIKNSEHLMRCLLLGLPIKKLGGVIVKFGEPIDPPEKPTEDKLVMARVLEAQREMYNSLP